MSIESDPFGVSKAFETDAAGAAKRRKRTHAVGTAAMVGGSAAGVVGATKYMRSGGAKGAMLTSLGAGSATAGVLNRKRAKTAPDSQFGLAKGLIDGAARAARGGRMTASIGGTKFQSRAGGKVLRPKTVMTSPGGKTKTTGGGLTTGAKIGLGVAGLGAAGYGATKLKKAEGETVSIQSDPFEVAKNFSLGRVAGAAKATKVPGAPKTAKRVQDAWKKPRVADKNVPGRTNLNTPGANADFAGRVLSHKAQGAALRSKKPKAL